MTTQRSKTVRVSASELNRAKRIRDEQLRDSGLPLGYVIDKALREYEQQNASEVRF